MSLSYKKVHPNARTPYRAHLTDAGFDLYSLNDVVITPNSMTKIRTGISICISSPDLVGVICDKSSKALKGLKVCGGIIDSGYTGELIVIATKIGGNENIEIKASEAIAQLLIHKIERFSLVENGPFLETDRGENGFGSTHSGIEQLDTPKKQL